MKIDIPDYIQDILNEINSYGYEAYLVGGSVRDSVIGRDNDDYDICTNMPLAEVKNIFPRFTIMKENNHRNTGICKVNNKEIEISTFRGNNLKEDLSERDITINAIACDKGGNIIDYFNGVEDIKNKKIKLIKEDGTGLINDPLRIMRIIRFSSILDFEIDDKTKQTIIDKKSLLNNIPKERIYFELKKILKSNKPSKLIRDNKEVFCEIIPELEETIDFEQNNPYHIYDVFEHTMKVLDNTPNNVNLRIAALFHDIGKPRSYTQDESGMGHFYGHPKVSNMIFEEFADEYKVDKKTKEAVSKLIINHDRCLSTKKVKVNKTLCEFNKEELTNLFLLKKADILGQNPEYINRLSDLEEIEKIYMDAMNSNPTLSIKDLKINGYKLMEMGFFDKKIGIILKDVFNKVVTEQVKNQEDAIESYISSKYKKEH